MKLKIKAPMSKDANATAPRARDVMEYIGSVAPIFARAQSSCKESVNQAPQGSWFENVLPWWKRRNHPNVLFLKYENMKKDLTGAIQQIAEFMGKTLSDDVIDKIAEASTFKAMKNNPSSNPDTILMKDIEQAGMEKPKDKSFMRKGVVGDWKNYFTDDQNKRFDELYKKQMAGSGLEFEF
ncbi:sulfotransferase 1C2-like [Lytechinus pictus]|uniref:sulfotransferase 1C2-like n=1 Tax=Lytechinus pictus TaxID=7653 RepID=UPI0030BA2782